ncbi:hypothetical protein [Halalkalicoccus salilacus]|uniref:hypothetical protein n=1 Tax=Halalkalicoccus TaxID=332246 RepID=UPI002F963DE1
MGSQSSRDDGAFSDGFAVPITGLLAFVFALMAGMTVLPALSGSLGDLALPIIFGGASVLCFRLRQRYIAAREDG